MWAIDNDSAEFTHGIPPNGGARTHGRLDWFVGFLRDQSRVKLT